MPKNKNESLGKYRGGREPSMEEFLPNFISSIASGPLGVMQVGEHAGRQEWAPQTLPGPHAEDQSISLSMIPTLQNLGRFNKQLRDLSEHYKGQGMSDEAALALGYTQTRYPNRFKKISGVGESFEGGYGGEFLSHPEDTATGGVLERLRNLFTGKDLSAPGPGSIRINPTRDDMEDVVNSLAHETQHGVDYLRKGGTPYIQKGRTIAQIKEDIHKLLTGESAGTKYYRQIPSEARAYQAGDTAAQSYQKYLDLMAQSRKNRGR